MERLISWFKLVETQYVAPIQDMGHERGQLKLTRNLNCDVPHRIWENVPSAIYVEAPLNQVDTF